MHKPVSLHFLTKTSALFKRKDTLAGVSSGKFMPKKLNYSN
ncbi:hypothetical protein J522_3602 [Acinetobacter baumannii 146457]|nr:hypothetical protein J522_3602 [Acinetobacter baumannii 146457]